jgi:hypothetical protein
MIEQIGYLWSDKRPTFAFISEYLHVSIFGNPNLSIILNAVFCRNGHYFFG